MANLTLRAVKGSPLTNAEMDGNFEYFTGSHAITGSLIVTGGITGSLQGIISSSYAVTASYIQNAQTASYVATAQTASYVLNAVSSSRTVTASYALTAQTLLGSIESASYALTASNSSTSSYVAGGNVDGTVALASNAISSNEVYTALTNINGNYKILFTDNTSTNDSSNIYKDTDSTLLYNPGLNKLTLGAISASAGITGSLLGAASAVGTLVQDVVITGSLTQWSGSTNLGYRDGNGNYNFTSYKIGDNETIVIGANNGSVSKPNVLQMLGSNGQVLLKSSNELTLLSSNSNITLLANNTIVSGSVLISGSIVPNVPAGSTTSSFNLGSPTAAWKDIYVSNGTINFLNSNGTVAQTMGTGNNQLVGATFISGSLAQGLSPTASGLLSHAQGYVTTSSGDYSHAEGVTTRATGFGSHAEGSDTLANGSNSHAEGNYTTASGAASHAEGYKTLSSGQNSHAEGRQTTSSGQWSHAEGDSTIASGNYSHAEGASSQAQGVDSHAEGYLTISYGGYSHAEGSNTVSSGSGAHAEGSNTTAIGTYSHTEGNFTTALGIASHAEGENTVALGYGSHAEGNYTIASGSYQHVQGQYNTQGDSTSLMIVGNGTSTGARRDAFKVRQSGSIVLPTTQSSIPAWSGSNGEMVFATVSGANLFYVWMGSQWRSGSLA